MNRRFLTLILLGAAVWSLAQVPWSSDLVRPTGIAMVGLVLTGLATPDLSAAVLGKALLAAWHTLTYAVAGMSVAVLLAIPLGIFASGVLTRGTAARRLAMFSGRGVLGFARAIHELVWAWLFVAAIGLSPPAAILALAIPYTGILGRIYADLLNDVPSDPLQALRATGAHEGKVLIYGRLPAALADMVSYTFYRLECGLRSAAILSFVGLGGLGFQIQLALDDLLFGQVATYLLAMVLLILAVDSWSTLVRRQLAG